MQTFNSNDRAWLAAKGCLWAILEINTGLICACLPTLKSFFREVVPKLVAAKSWRLKGKVGESEDAIRRGGKNSDNLNV